jgi:predicted DNA-binding WGR domain protein
MSWFGIRSTRIDVRFYSLMIERDLFGTVRLVRNWGRFGTNRRELAEEYPLELEVS